MFKAFRYLKPFWLSVVAVIALVFAQVQFDLSLPDYMSRIVTYGIQYGGITEPVPQALTEETFEKLSYAADAQMLSRLYTRTSDPGAVLPMPIADEKSIYVLNGTPSEEDAAAVEEAYLLVTMAKASGLDPAAEGSIEKTKEALKDYTAENRQSAIMMALKQEYASAGINMEKVQNSYILREGMIMLAIALIASLCAVASSYLASRTATGAARQMRQDVFEKVETFSSEEFSRFSTASLITRTTNDVQQVQQILTMMLRIVLFAPMMGLTSLFKVLRYKNLASVLGWAVLFMIVMMIIVLRVTMPRFRIAQKLVDRLACHPCLQ